MTEYGKACKLTAKELRRLRQNSFEFQLLFWVVETLELLSKLISNYNLNYSRLAEYSISLVNADILASDLHEATVRFFLFFPKIVACRY